MDNFTWSKRKFKISRNQPAKQICEMNLHEAQHMKDYAFQMSNAAGYADEAAVQNRWIGIELECKQRIQQLTNET